MSITTPTHSTKDNACSSQTVLALHPTAADRIEALCFFGLDAALIWLSASGAYTRFATPRTLPYLAGAAVVLFVLGIAAWLGIFHAEPQSSKKLLVSLAIPTLLLIVPLQASANTGFDKYAGGRAIAMSNSVNIAVLHGLDETKKTLDINDDEFGAWFETIDHNPQRFSGYTIAVTGYVSTSNTLGSGQFLLARQQMSCCILDMTPFGFTTQQKVGASIPASQTWVRVTGTLLPGSIGKSGYSHQGMVLHLNSIEQTAAPTGYFYLQ